MTALRIGSLFSGVGGLDLAVELFFGAETVWHCEFDPEPSKVLAARWPGVPNLGDITQVDWAQVAPVDILCGGFPCQDLSLAGRRKGLRPGTRSGLWADFRTAIAALRPSVVVIENVRGLLSGCAESDSDVEPCPGCVGDSNQHRPLVRALGRVLGDLATLGFDAEWGSLRASDVGAPHGRFRVFVVAYTRSVRLDSWRVAGSGEASGGRASAVAGGRDGAPVTLLPTPQAHDERGGKTPDQVAAMRARGHGVSNLNEVVVNDLPLLPTPSASNPNDGEDIDGWLARRERVKATADNGNGFGTPLGVAVRLLPTPVTEPDTGNGHARNLGKEVRLLPTPQVADAEGGHARRGGDRGDELLLPGVATTLLPTPRASDHKLSSSNSPSQQKHVEDGFGNLPEIVGYSLLPTPRASRGGSATETMYLLGAERDDEGDRQGNVVGQVSWGEYEPAIRRWEALTRPAPSPTRPDGKNGNHRLSPLLTEWMMGYRAGWVTDILNRDPAIKACGNGVCPQQAYAALVQLWARVIDTLGLAA